MKPAGSMLLPLVCAFWMGLGVSTASAQNRVDSRAVSGDVERLIANRSWAEATRRLERADAGCAGGAEGRDCRLQLAFTRGYLLQSQGENTPQASEPLLRSSAEAYRTVLAEAPGHPATVHNLALVLGSLGETAELERLLEDAIPRSEGLAGEIAMVLGDAYGSAARWPDAVTAYTRAVRLSETTTAQRKLIRAASRLPEIPEAIPRLAQDWAVRTPAIAADAYALVCRTGLDWDDARAVQALLRWIALRADTRTLSSAAVAETFAGVEAAALSQLEAFLWVLESPTDDPLTDPETAKAFPTRHPPMVMDYPWWRDDLDRRHALGLAALSLGRANVAEGKPLQAQYALLVGLQTAPLMGEYIAEPERFDRLVPLESITELVWLQVRYPDLLDPSGQKFEAFIDLLIEGKGDAYASGDLVAIQRHHMVLGPIFAARGRWTGGRYGFDNALFQLSHAVRAANEREASAGFHQALPTIKATLADGYQASGQPAREREARLDAIQAALDNDDLSLARVQYTAFDRTEADDTQRARAAALRAILGARLDRGTDVLPTWATAESIDGLDREFLRRQQFKLLANRIETATPAQRPALARRALARGDGVSTLIGMADVLRIERALGALAGEEANPRLAIHPAGPDDSPGDGRWLLSLPSSDRPFVATRPES